MKPLKPMPESGKAIPPATAATERQAFVEVVELIQTAGQRIFFIVLQSPQTLYAGAGGEIFTSTDGGKHWTACNVGFPTTVDISALVIDPTNPQILYTGTDQGVFKSTNAGKQWSVSNNGLTDSTIEALIIDPKTPLTLYAGTSTGIVKSTNDRESWDAVK